MWINREFYNINDKGEVLIPFVDKSIKFRAILVNDNFAITKNINLKEELYDFSISYIYDYESFLLGNNVKILLKPRLLINNTQAGISLIKNVRASVETINAKNIPSFINFNNLIFRDDEETEVKFPIAANIL